MRSHENRSDRVQRSSIVLEDASSWLLTIEKPILDDTRSLPSSWLLTIEKPHYWRYDKPEACEALDSDDTRSPFSTIQEANTRSPFSTIQEAPSQRIQEAHSRGYEEKLARLLTLDDTRSPFSTEYKKLSRLLTIDCREAHFPHTRSLSGSWLLVIPVANSGW